MDATMTARPLIVSTAMLCGTLLVCVWLYANCTRYAMLQSGDRAYRYDRITGELWLVSGRHFGPVDGPVRWGD